MNAFDGTILTFLNSFARQSRIFDQVIVSAVGNNLFKGGMIIAIFWGLWFTRSDREQEQIRKSILVTFVGTFAGLFITRILVNILPFRPRPIHNMAFPFVFPYGVCEQVLADHAMSFPSDHATMFFGLATGIFLISRRLGFLVSVYLFFNTFLLRVYYGYHHPTDIIAGALIGVASVMLVNTQFVRRHVVDKIFDVSLEYPRIFYGMFFLVSYQSATLFDDSRKLAAGVLRFLKIMAGRLG